MAGLSVHEGHQKQNKTRVRFGTGNRFCVRTHKFQINLLFSHFSFFTLYNWFKELVPTTLSLWSVWASKRGSSLGGL